MWQILQIKALQDRPLQSTATPESIRCSTDIIEIVESTTTTTSHNLQHTLNFKCSS